MVANEKLFGAEVCTLQHHKLTHGGLFTQWWGPLPTWIGYWLDRFIGIDLAPIKKKLLSRSVMLSATANTAGIPLLLAVVLVVVAVHY